MGDIADGPADVDVDAGLRDDEARQFRRGLAPVRELASRKRPQARQEAAGLLKGGQSGEPAIVPGKPDASPLWKRVAAGATTTTRAEGPRP